MNAPSNQVLSLITLLKSHPQALLLPLANFTDYHLIDILKSISLFFSSIDLNGKIS